MADTSTHYKQMKNLVSPEIFMSAVKNWKFQCVNNSANCVDDTTCPAHSDIQHRREPFWTVDPKCFDQYSEDCNAPYDGKKNDSGCSF